MRDSLTPEFLFGIVRKVYIHYFIKFFTFISTFRHFSGFLFPAGRINIFLFFPPVTVQRLLRVYLWRLFSPEPLVSPEPLFFPESLVFPGLFVFPEPSASGLRI